MNRGCILLVIFITVAILTCGCTTKYGPRDFFGEGYTESRIGADMYRVNFECNGDTSEALCDGFLFRRCAELTLQSGYDHFTMIDHTYDIRLRSYYVPGHMDRIQTVSADGTKTTSYKYTPGYTATSASPIASATIRLTAGVQTANNQYTFDAREITKYASLKD